MQLLEETHASECAYGCYGNWRIGAAEFQGRQGIMKGDFCNAVYFALAKGRGKYQNLYIHDPKNFSKSFILSVLKVV